VAPQSDFLISLDSKIDQLLREVHPQVAGKKTKSPESKWIHRGRLHYEAGCNQLYAGGEYFNLENNARARWCIDFLISRGAFSPETGCHFVDEIDVFVRGKTGHPAASSPRIYDYFKDQSGRLHKLQQLVIRSGPESGKFYLLAG
jgi:hypothetical protein